MDAFVWNRIFRKGIKEIRLMVDESYCNASVVDRFYEQL